MCDSASAGDSAKLITGSADSSARLWDLQTGKSLHTFQFNEPCRGVKFAVGDGMAAISSDPFMGVPACIYLVTIAEDAAEQDTTILQQLKGPTGRIQRVEWTDLNRTLISAGEDGIVRRWDAEVRAEGTERKVKTKFRLLCFPLECSQGCRTAHLHFVVDQQRTCAYALPACCLQ